VDPDVDFYARELASYSAH